MKQNKNNTKKAVIYCRVSTTKQASEGDSLKNQENVCRTYCNTHYIQVKKVFREAFTGKSSDRPEFNHAIQYAQENNINYFVVFDIDRFSREGYSVFQNLKQKLQDSNIILKDTKNIIQGDVVVYNNDIIDASIYSWNRENSSEYAEVMLSTYAKTEGKKILQRIITREIQLEQMGYKVRQANFGYKNEKIKIPELGGKKATIQVEHPIYGPWLKNIFYMRASGQYTDKQIVNTLNTRGFRTLRNKPLTVKRLQVYVCNPIYAAIVIGKWTGNKPIKAPYKGLVDIDTWNQANKGKVKIIETDNNEVLISYNNDGNLEEERHIKTRKSYNPEFCFSKFLICPNCGKTLTGSKSIGRNKKPHYYYFCKGKGRAYTPHKMYSLKRDEVHKKISKAVKSITFSDDTMKVYEEMCRETFKNYKEHKKEEKKGLHQQIVMLEKRKVKIIESIDALIPFPDLLEAKNKELGEITIDIEELKVKVHQREKEISVENFIKYSIYVLKHLDKLLELKENKEMIALVFNICFGGQIVFEKINSQTISNSDLSSILKQKKSQINEISNENPIWYTR